MLEHIFKAEIGNDIDRLFRNCKTLDKYLKNLRVLEKKHTDIADFCAHGFQSLVEAMIRHGKWLNDYEVISSADADLMVHGKGNNLLGYPATVCALYVPVNQEIKPQTIHNGLGKFIGNSQINDNYQVRINNPGIVMLVFANAIGFHPRTIQQYMIDLEYNYSVFICSRKYIEKIIDNREDFWSYFKKHLNTTSTPEKVYQPRNDQIQAVEKLWAQKKGICIYPTGGGKTKIQAMLIERAIRENPVQVGWSIPVCLLMSPRIMLSAQHLKKEIAPWLRSKGIDVKYCFLSSGRYDDEEDKRKAAKNGLIPRDVLCTTLAEELSSLYKKCIKEGTPLVIVGTIQSAHRLMDAGLEINLKLTDEAHNLVHQQGRFSDEDKEKAHLIISNRTYHFTATRADTKLSEDSSGMNNSKLFGEVLVDVTPRELIEMGVIVPPKVIVATVGAAFIRNNKNVPEEIDLTTPEAAKNVEVLASILIKVQDELNNQHQIDSCDPSRIGSKLLINCKGEPSFAGLLLNSKTFKEYRENHSRHHFLGISSASGFVYNGQIVAATNNLRFRDEFKDVLETIPDDDSANIINIAMINEGLDAPGITACTSLRELGGEIPLKQFIGRPMRRHPDDAKKAYIKGDGSVIPLKANEQVKPYAYVVVIICPWDNDANAEEKVKNVVRQICKDYVSEPTIVYVGDSPGGEGKSTVLTNKIALPSGKIIDQMDILFEIWEPELHEIAIKSLSTMLDNEDDKYLNELSERISEKI